MGLLEGLSDLETTTSSCILEFNKWKTKTTMSWLLLDVLMSQKYTWE